MTDSFSCAAAAAVAVLALGASAAKIAPEPDELDYTYVIDRRDTEKKPGSLRDHDTGGISWHTKFKSTTDVVCELKETCEIDKIEIQVSKWTKWYIISEFRVSVDDGLGDFGDPVILPGLPRSDGGKELRDPSCTNHVFTATNLGKAVRVKVQVVSDAAAGIGEIRLFGRPAAKASAQAPAVLKEATKKGNFRKVENRQWKLEVNPVGGQLQSMFSKAIGTEVTDPSSRGSFTEEVWDRRASHEFLLKKPFAVTYESGAKGGQVVTAVGNAQGGGIDFLKVIKRYSISDDSTSLAIDYRFENLPEAMALQNYAPLVHATLGVFRRDVTCFYPSTEGIDAIRPGKRHNEYWGHHPARGWMAAATDEGTGVAITMPFRDVKAFYSWFSQVPTLEWRMTSVALKEGEGYDVATELIPFKGLPVVSGAGGGFVGMLDGGICRIVSARAGNVEVEEIGAVKNTKATKRGIVFGKPGETQEFRTEATTVVITRGGREVCRLEAKPKEGAWSLARECASRESSVAEADLTCYTNFTPSVCFPWAKPLAGKKLRVSAVTGYGGVVEFGRLADRFDMEYRIIGVSLTAARKLGSPIFSDGDNFSLVNTGDFERGIAKVLAFDSDVVLIAGIPYDALAKDLRTALTAKVKKGAGLVWIGDGKRCPPPEIEGGRIVHLDYNAMGSEPWHAPALTPIDMKDFYEDHAAPVEAAYSRIAKALVEAGGKKLPVEIVSGEVGPGSASFAVNAVVPGQTWWKWSVTDPFGTEIAAGEEPVKLVKGAQTVRFGAFAVPRTAGELSFAVCVRTKRGGVLNWGRWSFRNPPKAEIVSLKVDDRWHEEGDEVKFTAGLKDDTAGMKLKFELVDSWGRLIAEKEAAAAEKVAESFRLENALVSRCYTIEARLITRDGARESGPCSRRRAEVRCRPADAKMAWDDFEVGTWANANYRGYLWPEIAAMFRRVGISTIIANPGDIQINFTMRHNINPTLLSDAGLGRSSEPQEYTKTGDKMKLVRGTCLSSPKFFEKREKSLGRLTKDIRRHGYRFVWFGDEQSITGYGGTPVDFCFSEHCLKEMRAFAKGKYGTLEKLNSEWETSFGSWDEVVPFTRQEVWAANGRHVAGWADHLEFMDSRLTNSIAYSVRPLHEVDPTVRFALSGTQQPSAYGGTDWWKQMNVMDAALNYGTGGQFDIHRSFNPEGGFMPWNWGYGQRGAVAADSVWKTAFYGMRGIIGFQSSSQFNRDWTYSQGLRDSAPHIRRLADGTGMHFVNNLKTRHDVAILYSQASLRAAFIQNRRPEHDQLEEKVRRLLRNLGYAYDYVSYDQLAAGEVAKRGYRALILADAVAMGDAECEGVKAFAKAGGLVIAEGVPAVLQQNCVKRSDTPLADLFGAGSRHVLFEKVDVRYLKAVEYPDKPENAPVVAEERTRYGAALAKAGAAAGRMGIYNAENGRETVNAEIWPKADAEGNPTWCVLSSGKVRETKFVFPKEGYVFDLVSGRAYGKVKELRLPFGRGVPYAFAQYDAETPSLGAVHVRVYRPDGTEADCYAKNVLVKGGRWTYSIPFALSDPKGEWKIAAESVFGRRIETRSVVR